MDRGIRRTAVHGVTRVGHDLATEPPPQLYECLKGFFCVFFFFTRTIFKAFIEFVTISFLFFVLFFWLQGTWDLNLPDRGLYPHPLR